jgi:hypothetical protein
MDNRPEKIIGTAEGRGKITSDWVTTDLKKIPESLILTIKPNVLTGQQSPPDGHCF